MIDVMWCFMVSRSWRMLEGWNVALMLYECLMWMTGWCDVIWWMWRWIIKWIMKMLLYRVLKVFPWLGRSPTIKLRHRDPKPIGRKHAPSCSNLGPVLGDNGTPSAIVHPKQGEEAEDKVHIAQDRGSNYNADKWHQCWGKRLEIGLEESQNGSH